MIKLSSDIVPIRLSDVFLSSDAMLKEATSALFTNLKSLLQDIEFKGDFKESLSSHSIGSTNLDDFVTFVKAHLVKEMARAVDPVNMGDDYRSFVTAQIKSFYNLYEFIVGMLKKSFDDLASEEFRNNSNVSYLITVLKKVSRLIIALQRWTPEDAGYSWMKAPEFDVGLTYPTAYTQSIFSNKFDMRDIFDFIISGIEVDANLGVSLINNLDTDSIYSSENQEYRDKIVDHYIEIPMFAACNITNPDGTMDYTRLTSLLQQYLLRLNTSSIAESLLVRASFPVDVCKLLVETSFELALRFNSINYKEFRTVVDQRMLEMGGEVPDKSNNLFIKYYSEDNKCIDDYFYGQLQSIIRFYMNGSRFNIEEFVRVYMGHPIWQRLLENTRMDLSDSTNKSIMLSLIEKGLAPDDDVEAFVLLYPTHSRDAQKHYGHIIQDNPELLAIVTNVVANEASVIKELIKEGHIRVNIPYDGSSIGEKAGRFINQYYKYFFLKPFEVTNYFKYLKIITIQSSYFVYVAYEQAGLPRNRLCGIDLKGIKGAFTPNFIDWNNEASPCIILINSISFLDSLTHFLENLKIDKSEYMDVTLHHELIHAMDYASSGMAYKYDTDMDEESIDDNEDLPTDSEEEKKEKKKKREARAFNSANLLYITSIPEQIVHSALVLPMRKRFATALNKVSSDPSIINAIKREFVESMRNEPALNMDIMTQRDDIKNQVNRDIRNFQLTEAKTFVGYIKSILHNIDSGKLRNIPDSERNTLLFALDKFKSPYVKELPKNIWTRTFGRKKKSSSNDIPLIDRKAMAPTAKWNRGKDNTQVTLAPSAKEPVTLAPSAKGPVRKGDKLKSRYNRTQEFTVISFSHDYPNTYYKILDMFNKYLKLDYEAKTFDEAVGDYDDILNRYNVEADEVLFKLYEETLSEKLGRAEEDKVIAQQALDEAIAERENNPPTTQEDSQKLNTKIKYLEEELFQLDQKSIVDIEAGTDLIIRGLIKDYIFGITVEQTGGAFGPQINTDEVNREIEGIVDSIMEGGGNLNMDYPVEGPTPVDPAALPILTEQLMGYTSLTSFDRNIQLNKFISDNLLRSHGINGFSDLNRIYDKYIGAFIDRVYTPFSQRIREREQKTHRIVPINRFRLQERQTAYCTRCLMYYYGFTHDELELLLPRMNTPRNLYFPQYNPDIYNKRKDALAQRRNTVEMKNEIRRYYRSEGVTEYHIQEELSDASDDFIMKIYKDMIKNVMTDAQERDNAPHEVSSDTTPDNNPIEFLPEEDTQSQIPVSDDDITRMKNELMQLFPLCIPDILSNQYSDDAIREGYEELMHGDVLERKKWELGLYYRDIGMSESKIDFTLDTDAAQINSQYEAYKSKINSNPIPKQAMLSLSNNVFDIGFMDSISGAIISGDNDLLLNVVHSASSRNDIDMLNHLVRFYPLPDIVHNAIADYHINQYMIKKAQAEGGYDYWLDRVNKGGQSLHHVPDEFKDYNLCLAAVKQNGLALAHIRKEKRNYDICVAAVKQNGEALRFVPYEIKDEQMILSAYKRTPKEKLFSTKPGMSYQGKKNKFLSLAEQIKNTDSKDPNRNALIKQFRDNGICKKLVQDGIVYTNLLELSIPELNSVVNNLITQYGNTEQRFRAEEKEWIGDQKYDVARNESAFLLYLDKETIRPLLKDKLLFYFLTYMPTTSHFFDQSTPIGWALVSKYSDKIWVINQVQSDLMHKFHDMIKKLKENIVEDNKKITIDELKILLQANNRQGYIPLILQYTLLLNVFLTNPNEMMSFPEAITEEEAQKVMNQQQDIVTQALITQKDSYKQPLESLSLEQLEYIKEKLSWVIKRWPNIVFQNVWEKANAAGVETLYWNTVDTVNPGIFGAPPRPGEKDTSKDKALFYYEYLPVEHGFTKVKVNLRNKDEELHMRKVAIKLSNVKKANYGETPSGEFWIIDGQAIGADGDVGDYDHISYVIEAILSNKDIRDSEELEEIELRSQEEFGNREKILKEDYGFSAEELAIVRNKGEFGVDGRAYATKNFGWKRLTGNTIDTFTLTSSDLRYIVNGVYDANSHLFDTGEEHEDFLFDIYLYSTNVVFEDVPWSVLEEGNVSSLIPYRRKYASKKNNSLIKLSQRKPSIPLSNAVA